MSSSGKEKFAGNPERKIEGDSHEGLPEKKAGVEGPAVEVERKPKGVAAKRLAEEFNGLNAVNDMRVRLKEGNLFEWEATIQGPVGSPYEGGTFLLDLNFPNNYPFMPPKITFRTKIYHCNVDSDGSLSILDRTKGSQWSPILTVEIILLIILSFLNDCDHEMPLRLEVAAQYVNNREEHDRICREWTLKHAIEESA